MSRRTAVVALVLSQSALLSAGATAALARPTLERPLPVVAAAPVERGAHPALVSRRVVAPQAVAKPKPKPKPRHKAVRRAPVRRAVVHHAQPVHHATTSLTPQQRMMRAVSRLPGYHSGDAVWAISSDWGHWGVADLYHQVAYISPTVPADRMYDVVAHEWSHLLSVQAYGLDVTTAMSAMNSYFGGSDLMGAERAADCMARLLGATWTHYTSCQDSHWRDGARRLLARQRL
jgi:hypothetical protein